jgi:hypothetical protein
MLSDIRRCIRNKKIHKQPQQCQNKNDQVNNNNNTNNEPMDIDDIDIDLDEQDASSKKQVQILDETKIVEKVLENTRSLQNKMTAQASNRANYGLLTTVPLQFSKISPKEVDEGWELIEAKKSKTPSPIPTTDSNEILLPCPKCTLLNSSQSYSCSICDALLNPPKLYTSFL